MAILFILSSIFQAPAMRDNTREWHQRLIVSARFSGLFLAPGFKPAGNQVLPTSPSLARFSAASRHASVLPFAHLC